MNDTFQFLFQLLINKHVQFECGQILMVFNTVKFERQYLHQQLSNCKLTFQGHSFDIHCYQSNYSLVRNVHLFYKHSIYRKKALLNQSFVLILLIKFQDALLLILNRKYLDYSFQQKVFIQRQKTIIVFFQLRTRVSYIKDYVSPERVHEELCDDWFVIFFCFRIVIFQFDELFALNTIFPERYRM